MKNNHHILQELQEISPLLAQLKKLNVYSVPDGYFDVVPLTILACLQENESFSSNTSINVLSDNKNIPENYFADLSSNILNKIAIDSVQSNQNELNSISPIVANIRRVNTYTIPDGYFNQLPASIFAAVNRSKVVKMPTKWIKYAVAAAFTGIVSLGIYTFSGKETNTNSNTSTIASLDQTIEKGKKMDEAQFNQTLSNLSEDAISKYLEKNSDESDLAYLASGIEDNNLPATDDYFTNDKTLQNYINEINNINN